MLDKRAEFLQSSAHMKTTTLPIKHLVNRSSVRLAFILIPLALACFALSPQAHATCQDACLPNTVQGEDALISNTTGLGDTATGYWALLSNTTGGLGDTATGYWALLSNTTGSFNTANGAHALQSNTTGHDNTAIGNSALIVNT